MKIFNYPSEAAEEKLNQIVGRGGGFNSEDVATVSNIIETVREKGDEALIEYTRRFDSPEMTLEKLRVSKREMADAADNISPAFRKALDRAAGQIESYHRKQVKSSWVTDERPGTLLGQLVRPVDTAGIYVPGGQAGKTPLVSTALMCAIPARIAGVANVIMVTPPCADGSVDPRLLAAAERAGVDAIYKIGSAWAIAALAHGTESIPRADVIVGPGNIFVTIAKKLVSGLVGIDMVAGPSEILVVADASADPAYAAADLLSQAEHDPLASAVLVTDSEELAQKVLAEVNRQIKELTRSAIAAGAVRDYGAILVVEDLLQAFDLANRIAPEHLELLIKNPFAHLGRIRNAGAVFVGEHCPEPVGDYIAGPNHVLPTAGTARFSSALSVDHFIKKTSVIYYDRAAFDTEAPDILELAKAEGLDAHARSVRVRMKH